MRFRAATAVLALVLVALPGCGMDDSREGPPFEPDNIGSPRALLITNSDVEEVGASTPYGAVLSWWRALQHGNVGRVRGSYTSHLTRGEAKRQIDHLYARFSQPVEPEIEKQHHQAKLIATMRAATPRKDTPSVVAITDFRTSFLLVRRGSGWKLRPSSFRRYRQSWERRRLATQR